MSGSVDTPDWSTIPAPVDDGATRHLTGARVPSVPLPATEGSTVDLSRRPGRSIVYAYPRTGRPGVPNPDGWDLIPGARGCTPQACAFRDHFADLKALGVARVFGLSTQTTELADATSKPNSPHILSIPDFGQSSWRRVVMVIVIS